ncbi:HAD family hydrolase [Pseudonocardia hispaniensis]|uniref:HAD family hydrolase n=1 Tax=Pseudonocardia hispaniensis TaxID=904933 RepID=A0ABW1IZK5_9PSEU
MSTKELYRVPDVMALLSSGHTVTVVSNNSETAIRAFIQSRDIADLFDGVVGRTRARYDDLKPTPYLLHRALGERGARPAESFLIGDSLTDIQAARAAGVAAVAFANKADKQRSFAAAGPDALILAMSELAAAA